MLATYRAAWPEPQPGFADAEAEAKMKPITEVLGEFRAAKKLAGPDRLKVGMAVLEAETDRTWDQDQKRLLTTLSSVRLVSELPWEGYPTTIGAVTFLARARTQGELNIAEIGRKSAQLEIIESKLANQEFVAKAPAEVVEKNRRIADELRIEIDRLQGGTT